MRRPTLVVISGPAGTGKTTLAHALARELGCPAICRDEIKEGMVHAAGGFDAGPGDPLSVRTLPLYFELVGLLLARGVTVVAEAAFQDRLWRPHLEPLLDLGSLRVVQCHCDRVVARRRILARAGSRPAHADAQLVASLTTGDRYFDDFVRVSVAAPSLDVDTTGGYAPALTQIVAFVNAET